MNKKKNLSTIVVIGAGSGIGLNLVIDLAQNSQSRIIAVRKKNKIPDLKILQNVSNISWFFLNAGEEDQVAKFSEDLKSQNIILDGLVVTGGSSQSNSLAENSSQGFIEDYKNNAFLSFLNILHLHKLMRENSSIVLLSSIRGQTATPSGLGYAAAKSAVISLAKSSALQLAPLGIRVNCISPSAVYPTGMSSHWTEEKRLKIASSIPLGRLATPKDIIGPIKFLLSNESSFITGQVINVNGGELI